MGLGKTIQTIALLAYLACEKQVWGPHLIVVPTSVILNWEMELKKWLPGFKIMTYYGSPKERKEKRSGWSKDNAFHVCITSYQLVLQDQNAFRRKQWQYLILDEAHHIKNFRSQRWQVLLNFNSKRRLLLTGTPLQNNLMELWSLLYFLMPNGVSQDMPIGFANLKEFQEWFSNPVDRMIENQQQHDEESRGAIQKLHTVLRPYLLRRLKADVEKQMPEKHEHIVYCKLSKRQRYLYDDFMNRGKTKETLASGNFLNIINCLMQLRKVCNHPDLFEERPILTSFAMNDEIHYLGESLESKLRIYQKPFEKVDFGFLNLILMDQEHNKIISQSVAQDNKRLEATKEMMKTIAKHQKRITIAESRGVTSRDYHDLKKYAKYREMQMHIHAVNRWQSMNYINHFRCARKPMYDSNLIQLVSTNPIIIITGGVVSYKDRIEQNLEIINQVGFVTPKVVVYNPNKKVVSIQLPEPWATATSVENDIFHPIESRLSIAFPDKRLLQYDCGKLQKLDKLLRKLAAGGHRALIFTQMTRVLDVLETFLNMHGHRYLRLDGATKVEQRQILTEHFNNDKRILCFILSTRSGGLGINLTGADTVIFYDSDWNPSMDKQCQDRAHRIGQTRDVHIYRFVTEFTIEENIFKKANQKRLLDNVIIQEGDFTDDYFHKNEWWKDLPEVLGGNKSIDYEQALLEAEDDENDAAAAIAARKEMNMDDNEFKEDTPRYQSETTPTQTRSSTPVIISSSTQPSSDNEDDENQEEEEEVVEDENMQLNIGHVDQYMLQFWEREEIGINLGFGGI
ncbi:P-loop containing nucleoside triphosphate hydrolase protein [Pilaira anomala]|nr:P-loop containing nucleoside triphosphate hydrolase protein [Pilaira anomala]